MKKILRLNVFETNSSTTHNIIILSEEDYEKWLEEDNYYTLKENWYWIYENKPVKPKRGILYSRDEAVALLKMLHPNEDYSDEDLIDEALREEGFITSDQWDNLELEQNSEEFVSPSGDRMIALCAYGMEY